MLADPLGASFDQGQVDRLRRAYEIARLSFCRTSRWTAPFHAS